MASRLLTAAMRPDEGEVRLFGKPTADIADYDAWLAMLDGLGLLSERAVLLEQCSVAQNLALPLTLTIDPIDPAVIPRVHALADEVGIPREALDTPVRAAGPPFWASSDLCRAAPGDSDRPTRRLFGIICRPWGWTSRWRAPWRRARSGPTKARTI